MAGFHESECREWARIDSRKEGRVIDLEQGPQRDFLRVVDQDVDPSERCDHPALTVEGIAAASFTSQTETAARPADFGPAWLIAAAADSSVAAVLPTNATRAPLSASSAAMPKPTPRSAPVTRAILPESGCVIVVAVSMMV